MRKFQPLALSLIILAGSSSYSHASRKRHSHDVDLQSVLANTAVPKDGDVCFSPEEHCDAKLIRLVQTAQSSIDVAIYDINHEKLVHEILVQSTKLKVRVLVDKRQSKEPKSLVGLLTKAGVSVRFGRQRGIMHNKFVIVDHRIVETGSYNFTNHATEANNENQIYIANPVVVKRFVDRFDQIWARGSPASVVREVSGQ